MEATPELLDKLARRFRVVEGNPSGSSCSFAAARSAPSGSCGTLLLVGGSEDGDSAGLEDGTPAADAGEGSFSASSSAPAKKAPVRPIHLGRIQIPAWLQPQQNSVPEERPQVQSARVRLPNWMGRTASDEENEKEAPPTTRTKSGPSGGRVQLPPWLAGNNGTSGSEERSERAQVQKLGSGRVQLPSWVVDNPSAEGLPPDIDLSQWRYGGPAKRASKQETHDAATRLAALQRTLQAAEKDRENAERHLEATKSGAEARFRELADEAARLRATAARMSDALDAFRNEAVTYEGLSRSPKAGASAGSGMGTTMTTIATDSQKMASELFEHASERRQLTLEAEALEKELAGQREEVVTLELTLDANRKRRARLVNKLHRLGCSDVVFLDDEALLKDYEDGSDCDAHSVASPRRGPAKEPELGVDHAGDIEFAYDWGLALAGRGMSISRALQLAKWASKRAGQLDDDMVTQPGEKDSGNSIPVLGSDEEDAQMMQEASTAPNMEDLESALRILREEMANSVVKSYEEEERAKQTAKEKTEAQFAEPLAALEAFLKQNGINPEDSPRKVRETLSRQQLQREREARELRKQRQRQARELAMQPPPTLAEYEETARRLAETLEAAGFHLPDEEEMEAFAAASTAATATAGVVSPASPAPSDLEAQAASGAAAQRAESRGDTLALPKKVPSQSVFFNSFKIPESTATGSATPPPMQVSAADLLNRSRGLWGWGFAR